MRLTFLTAFFLTLHGQAVVGTAWRHEHSVKGLPTTDGSNLTSYAGLVPVRTNADKNQEVLTFQEQVNL